MGVVKTICLKIIRIQLDHAQKKDIPFQNLQKNCKYEHV